MTVMSRENNFFARQARARKNRRLQVLLFAAAVSAIIAAATAALRLVWLVFLQFHTTTTFDPSAQAWKSTSSGMKFFDPAFFLFTGLLVVIVILGASIYKTYLLQGGGAAVAEMFGCRKIKADTDDPNERRLLNVVEEMSIASGIPVPLVYVMDSEHNINAFAAGHTLFDAAVTVTRGALDKLNRDELQGVIAHEFSHILNGDARLNLQMIGILFGILFLGIAGRKLLSTGKASSRAVIPQVVAGVLLVVIGYGGSFLGRLIQRAITRQQELLADATSVQFTRNPPGLAGALKKIGGSTFGALIISPAAAQAGHLFFAESQPASWLGFLATHPPLAERIRLLEPSFDGTFPIMKTEQQIPPAKYTTPYRLVVPSVVSGVALISAATADVVIAGGNPGPEHLAEGQAILNSLPADIIKSIQTPAGAASVIYALMMGNNKELRAAQTVALRRALVMHDETEPVLQLYRDLSSLKPQHRLPLIELAMPALSGLSGLEKRNFLLVLQTLINADGRVTLFELSVLWLLSVYLRTEPGASRNIDLSSFGQLGLAASILLAALANTGSKGNPAGAEAAFRAGVARIPELAARKPEFRYEEDFSYNKVNNALDRLSAAPLQVKQTLIDACAHCAFADSNVTDEETDLLRIIALALECPLPPFPESTPDPGVA